MNKALMSLEMCLGRKTLQTCRTGEWLFLFHTRCGSLVTWAMWDNVVLQAAPMCKLLAGRKCCTRLHRRYEYVCDISAGFPYWSRIHTQCTCTAARRRNALQKSTIHKSTIYKSSYHCDNYYC